MDTDEPKTAIQRLADRVVQLQVALTKAFAFIDHATYENSAGERCGSYIEDVDLYKNGDVTKQMLADARAQLRDVIDVSKPAIDADVRRANDRLQRENRTLVWALAQLLAETGNGCKAMRASLAGEDDPWME